jgi:two-component system LytT family sensor kinase
VNVKADNTDQRHTTVAILAESGLDSPNAALRPVTILVVTLFWISQFGANTIFTQLTSPEDLVVSLLPRACVCVAGELLTLGCIALQHRWRDSGLRVRVCWAIAFTILSSAALSAANYLIFKAFLGPTESSGLLVSVGYQLIPRFWVFGSVYAISLAISYWAEVRDREEEIAGLRALAQDAQLRALRTQLHPHFLFNALNSIAALIREGRPEQAEETTEHLADFLRMTLSLDPQRLITIGEETSLQRIYLDIQQVRFPTRLKVKFEIAPDVEDALVPSLILQPLVENSVKYAVARSTAPVTVEIRAEPHDGKLRITVQDDGGNASETSPAGGNRMGLANIVERLSAHFGDEGLLSFGPRTGGGFSSSILLPLCRGS